MLTLIKPPIVDKEKGTIAIWNDDKNEYEIHTFEFIEDLYSDCFGVVEDGAIVQQ